jgi:hypothetical protein
VAENVGSALDIVDQRITGDLNCFKEFIEKHSEETGTWRGMIDH